jgi:hypothetical protein
VTVFRAVIVVALLLTACGDHVASGGLPGGSSSAAENVGTINPKPTPTANPSPTAATVAFPDRLSFVVGTSDGLVYPEFVGGKPSGTPLRGCDGQVSTLASLGRKVLVVCREPTYRLSILDLDARTVSVISGVQASEAAWTVNGDAVVYTTTGSCEPSAPICKTRLMQRDLRTGRTTQIDERYGVGRDLRLSGNGLLIWRAKNMDSFVRAPEEVGTWLIIDGALVRFSPDRFVDGTKGRYVLETEEMSFNAGCCTAVISRLEHDQRLTPASVANERALALLEDGRILAFRADPDELFQGSMVLYRAGIAERMDRGRFSAFRAARDGDWIVGFELSGPPILTLHAYRISDGVFASVSGGNVTALAQIAPAKPPLP